MKKVLSSIVIVAMMAGFFAGFSASAEEVTDENGFITEGTVLVGYQSSVKNVSNVVIPDWITAINSYVFRGCGKIVSVEIPDSVKSMGSFVFAECPILESVNIPNGVKSVGRGLFYKCPSLKSISIPSSVEVIENAAFGFCESLNSVTISVGVKTIEQLAFEGCTSLVALNIPESVEDISSYAFVKCSSLEEIIVSSDNERYSSEDGVLFDKSKETLIQYPIGKSAWRYRIPDGVKDIDYESFEGCISLISVSVPNSASIINAKAFRGCSSLEFASIPESVTYIGQYAFDEGNAALVVKSGSYAHEWAIEEGKRHVFDSISDFKETSDVLDVLKLIVSSDFVGEGNLADVNGDGEVNSIDAWTILKYVLYQM
jgi:Dockerin type I repeat.